MAEDPVLVPEHETGASSHTEHVVTKSSTKEAKLLFNTAKQRLMTVSRWHEWCGDAGAVFTLTDEFGNEVIRPVQLGDHFRIAIPGPANKSGEGYDWVQVEAIEDKTSDIEDTEIFSLRVRPASNPREPGKEDVAHFFTGEASSTFTIRRDQHELIASVDGRNEKPNIEASGMVDKIRNAAVAIGAIAGLNKPQWKCLVEGLFG